MSGITVGTGLISGIDHTALVQQLIAVESQPRDLVLQRLGTIDAQKAAYLDISARISGLLSQIQFLTRTSSFQSRAAGSSKPETLSATAGLGTRTGAYQFAVRALASAHQTVSRGYTSRTSSVSPGTLTIESAQARVDRSTSLDELNGYSGVQRGKFKIIDSTGQSAVINIADALTVGEVVERINEANIGVTASVGADGLKLVDVAEGSGTMHVLEVSGGRTAADLGFGAGHTHAVDGILAGTNVMYLSDGTPLFALNDGLGVRTSIAGGDFSVQVGDSTVQVNLSETLLPETRLQRLNHGEGVRLGTVRITSRDGSKVTVDLSGAETVGDVQDALRNAFGDDPPRVSVTLNGNRLVVSDSTVVDTATGAVEYDFTIEDVSGYAAADLGITGAEADAQIDGREVLKVDTLADVIAAINLAPGNDSGGEPLVGASLSSDGRRIVLQSLSGGDFTLSAGSAFKALSDLGFEAGTYTAQAMGSRLIGGIDSVLLSTLNGGSGFAGGTIEITANGTTASVDLSGAETLADVIQLINDADPALGITAGYDSTGTRLLISNSDGGVTPIAVSGEFAEAIGLSWTGAALKSTNLQRQYISETTRLADLSNGHGVSYGKFRITNSIGASATITVSPSAHTTLQDVIDDINGQSIGVEAQINDTGDGLVLIDTTSGTGRLSVTDEEGTSARDLNIAGTAAEGESQIDGSFEFQFDTGGGETLEALVARIGSTTTLASATLLNDGTGIAPYRLSIASRMSGRVGALIIDEGTTGLGINLLTEAQDARVLFGGSTDSGILLTSATNTFENVVDGLDITANSADGGLVTVTVQDNIDSVVEALNELVADYNNTIDRIKEVSKYDQETEEKGILLGEAAVRAVENRLYNAFTRRAGGATGGLTYLYQVGLKMENGSLTLDEDKFREAFAANPQAVQDLFTNEETGIANAIKTELEQLTETDGVIPSRTETLDDKREILQTRVDRLNDMLDRKEARLLRQFQVMETILAQLQTQQTSLSNLSSLLASSGTGEISYS